MPITIETTASPELEEAFARLVPQLSRTAQPPAGDDVAKLLDQDAIDLLVYRDAEGVIVGMLSLVTFMIPTGTRSWIEDVVVDGKARGLGVGRKLVEAAQARAKELGAKTVDLTSRPYRESANRLYQRCGFVQRDTNIYRWE